MGQPSRDRKGASPKLTISRYRKGSGTLPYGRGSVALLHSSVVTSEA